MGLRPSGMKTHERRTCTRLSDKRNQSGRNSLVRYVVARNESLSSSVRYEESSRRDFICPVQSGAKRKLVIVRRVPGIMREGHCPSVTKSPKRTASPRPVGTTNHASETTSLQYEVTQGELVHVHQVRGINKAGLHPSGT